MTMIGDMDRALVGKMETALHEVCERFPARLWRYESQKYVAKTILACAVAGKHSPADLFAAASKAAVSLYAAEVVQVTRAEHEPKPTRPELENTCDRKR